MLADAVAAEAYKFLRQRGGCGYEQGGREGAARYGPQVA